VERQERLRFISDALSSALFTDAGARGMISGRDAGEVFAPFFPNQKLAGVHHKD
jgi:hypothetical protein